jgi:hypothetical protein
VKKVGETMIPLESPLLRPGDPPKRTEADGIILNQDKREPKWPVDL